MKKIRVLLAALALVAATAATAQTGSTTVNQGQGQGPNAKPWVFQIGGSGSTGVIPVSLGRVTAGAPLASVSTSSVSAAATALPTAGCFRVACTAVTYFRTGTGTPVALTTDNPLFGPAVEKVCLQSQGTAIAFVMASGSGTCTVTQLN